MDDLSGFHAAEDPKPRREVFLERIIQHKDWNFAAIVIEKNQLNPVLYEPQKFYPKFLSMVLRFVLRGRVSPATQQVLVYTDTLPLGSKKEANAANAAIKSTCRAELKGVPFRVMHHTSDSNYWIQIADYCSWALCRKWESNDTAAYDKLRPRLAIQELALMAKGDGTKYY